MKKQLFVLANCGSHNIKRYTIIPLLWGIIVFTIGCKKNTIEQINALPETSNLPSSSLTGVNFVYTEHSQLVMEIEAPEVDNYALADEPYMEFKNGLEVWFYDSTETLQSQIRANYAIFQQNQELWIARNNVVVINTQKNDTLSTEELYWDQAKGNIYTEKYVRIVNNDGIIHGKGLTAKQDLSNYRIKKPTGDLLIDEQSSEQPAEQPQPPATP
ncbi:MAG: LPS export ABC transporter periplasmic protein LptC [Bacteroidales bacterium]